MEVTRIERDIPHSERVRALWILEPKEQPEYRTVAGIDDTVPQMELEWAQVGDIEYERSIVKDGERGLATYSWI